jgi:GGDEF domain-containing protein
VASRSARGTISIGITLLRTDDISQSVIEHADNCLCAIKRHGVIASFARHPEAKPRADPEATPPARVA